VVCNFNLHVLAAGTPLSASAVRQFEALSYPPKRRADIHLLTSWLDMKLGADVVAGKMQICKWMADVFSTPQIEADLGSK
jgi:hypothetical protein